MTFFVFVVKNIGFYDFMGLTKKKIQHPTGPTSSRSCGEFSEGDPHESTVETVESVEEEEEGGGAARVQRHVDGTLRGKDGFPVQLLQRSEFWDWYRPNETFLILKEKLKLVDVLNLDFDQNQNSKI